MSVVNIPNHVQKSIERLLQQYKDKPVIKALIESFVEQVQFIEDALTDLNDNRSINTAIGVQLDRLGDILGIDRNGLSDEDYRARLKIKIVQNISNGEPDRLINVYSFLLGATQVQFQEHYPASMALMANAEVTAGQETLIYREIQNIAPAGARVDYIGCYDALNSFAFAGSNGPLDDAGADGFGDLTNLAIGGMFGKQHIPIDIGFAFEGGNPEDGGLGDLRDPYFGGLFN